MAVFHEGEIAVQARLGVQRMASRVGNGIYPVMPPGAQEFLEEQRWVIAASVGEAGDVWASVLAGEEGFIHATDDQHVEISAQPVTGDPLVEHLVTGGQVGLLVIDFANRARMRLNGRVVRSDANGLFLETEQVYGNCPKYIQQREVIFSPASSSGGETTAGVALSPEQQRWIASADTFFIASTHPQGGADASHRGGNPGFVRVLDANHLEFPDYAGNMMFNTLGNIAANPNAGLLFWDFERGHTLQVSGQASIIWDEARAAAFPGAQRVVEFTVESVVEIPSAVPYRFELIDYSRFNPR